MILRLVFAVALVTHFAAANIPASELNVPVFASMEQNPTEQAKPGKTDSTDSMEKVLGGIEKGAVAVTEILEKLKDVMEIASVAINVVPIVGQIASGLLKVLAFLKAPPPDPTEQMIKYVNKKIFENNQRIAMDNIEFGIRTIADITEFMSKQSVNYNANTVQNLYIELTRVIDHFDRESSGLLENSHDAVPALLSLAPIAAVVGMTYQKINLPDKISCKYAAVIDEFFQSFLLDRLINIGVDLRGFGPKNGYSYAESNKYILAQKAGFMEPLHVITKEVTEIPNCDFHQGLSKYQQETSQYTAQTILVKDNLMLEQNKFLICKETSGVVEYMKLVRYKIQQDFMKAYNLVNKNCAKPLQPTGMGWAHWFIGAVFIFGGATCGDISGGCDPYVQLSINNVPYTTKTLYGVNYYNAFNEMISTPKMHKKGTNCEMRLIDHNSILPDKDIIPPYRFQIGPVMPGTDESPGKLGLHFIGYWTDEYK